MTQETTLWTVRPKPQAAPVMRLICLPYAGGSASIYREWPRRLPEGIEVCAVQLPGREFHLAEEPYTRVGPLADKLCEVLRPLLDLPYALFGHSMGALIAFETALRLQAEGHPPLHLFASAQGAPQLRQPSAEPLHLLPDDRFAARLRKLEHTPEAVLQNAELMQLLMPMLRADFEICETYRYEPGSLVQCPISAYGGLEDAEIPTAKVQAWEDCTDALFTLKMVPGGHFFIHGEALPSILSDVSAKLLAQLSARKPARV